MLICLSLVVLFVAGGVAASDGEVVFSTLERYLGSDGDGGAFVGSASDGVRIALYGVDSPAHAASYILVIDGSTALTKGSSQTVISSPQDWLKGGAADFVALCGDRVAIVKKGSGFMTFSVDSFAASTTEWRLWETAETEWPVSHAAYLPESCDAFPGDLVVVEAFDRAVLVSNVRVTEGASVCQVDLAQWATVDDVALSRKKSATAYVVGTDYATGDRTVGVVHVAGDDCHAGWSARIDATTGTPQILAAETETRDEILLLSNTFFGRAATDGSSVFTLNGDGEKDLFLPGKGKDPVVAYSDHHDAIFSAGYVDGKALLRASRADDGRPLYEVDFRAGKGRGVGQLQTAPISVGFHSFRLIFRRAIISRNSFEDSMSVLERARAECSPKRLKSPLSCAGRLHRAPRRLRHGERRRRGQKDTDGHGRPRPRRQDRRRRHLSWRRQGQERLPSPLHRPLPGVTDAHAGPRAAGPRAGRRQKEAEQEEEEEEEEEEGRQEGQEGQEESLERKKEGLQEEGREENVERSPQTLKKPSPGEACSRGHS